MTLVRSSVLLFAAAIGVAQPVGSLKRVTLPERSSLNQYVQDQTALIVLGKALFWDMQSGSDGRLACASCHFHAGADHRVQNQLSNFSSGMVPNAVLTDSDFPFHLLSNPNNNRSAVVRDTSAVTGSAAILRRLLTAIVPGNPAEMGNDLTDAPAFSLNGINTRQVTTRNAPSVINAVFNFRNFWDGRASDIFTGATPFGVSDTGLHALNVSSGAPVLEAVEVTNSSLASQSVGPALNSGEMSYEGRSWAQIGQKVLSLQPLALQRVAPDDSVLGTYAVAGRRGLQVTSYQALVEAAFAPDYWQSDQLVDVFGTPAPDGEFTVEQYNFGLFWGLAIQAYESTLRADDSRVDQFFDGNSSALTPQEQRGLQLFQGRGNCTNCHAGAELTLASYSGVTQNRGGPGPGRGPLPDRGFFRTGVRPISDDVGLGGTDVFGNPLSRAVVNGAPLAVVQGLFKAPALRNVEFTGPYQHNGGQATLEQVIDFYSRGGDFPEGGNLGPGIGNKNFSQADRDAIVAFLKALSDDRVRYERAPFDHPEICVPVGEQSTDAASVVLDTSNSMFQLSAADKWAGIPEVGQGGNAVPLQTFIELLQGVGTDGSRAHTLQDACSVPIN
ncbi:MAG TPA: cytochrome c peroxidase [Bryobacteraceae bacterium]|nr:cytochrome c peroxidase [Bryobacteraceae bacterium]